MLNGVRLDDGLLAGGFENGVRRELVISVDETLSVLKRIEKERKSDVISLLA